MLKLFRFLKPHRFSVMMVLILMFLQALSQLYLPTLMSDIVDKGVVQGDIPYIWSVGGFMLLVAAGGTLCMVGASYNASRAATGFGRGIRTRMFENVSDFSLHEFDHIGTASLITRTTNDINQVQQVMIMMLRMFVMAPMNIIGGIIMAVSKDAALSLVLVVVVPILVATIVVIAGMGVPLFRSMQAKLDKIGRVLRENLTGIRVIRAFNRVGFEQKRFAEANLDLTETAVRANQIMASLWPIMMLLLNFSTIAIMWFGAKRIDYGYMQVGDLMAFIQYAMQILFSLLMVSMMFVMIPRASASAARIHEVLETRPSIRDASELRRTDESRQGYLEFDQVTFSYPGAEAPALSGITFRANPGEVTAIIGGTGSGKSTLVSLIPRFYDLDSGTIRIDGVDIREQSQKELRRKIGYVPQKALLFTGTVAENIRFGKDDASDEEVQHAAEVAQAADFIREMKDGFQSDLAQGGANLSGGQKQRLSIARALVRRPEIYIFDDSFSALDFKTDARLRAALRQETANSTVLIVAQRVSTIMDADRIIVLDEGRVVGIGTHRELLEANQVYREIVSSQLSEEEIA